MISILKLMPLLILVFLFMFIFQRWYRLAIFSISGTRIKGEITEKNRSKLLSSDTKGRHYYNFHYIYYDGNNTLRKGKMHKLYHSEQFKPGTEIDIIYLPHEPDESIIPSFREFLYYEVILLFATLLLSTISFTQI